MDEEKHQRPASSSNTLDPTDWKQLREQGHRMLDDMFDYLESLRERPVWQPIPPNVRSIFRPPQQQNENETPPSSSSSSSSSPSSSSAPSQPTDLAEVHNMFLKNILPYCAGNSHPGFMGWVQGGGTPVGMLSEMLAGALNANCGGRDQIPLEIERQITRWMADFYSFPQSASGIIVTGSSMANLIAIWVARTKALGTDVRRQGLSKLGAGLVGYTSIGSHQCISRAMDLAGLGCDSLRLIAVNEDFQMDMAALQAAIAADRAAGLKPFFIAATAGTVDVGAVDPLSEISIIAKREEMWFHVDGAFGALGILSPEVEPLLAGIQKVLILVLL